MKFSIPIIYDELGKCKKPEPEATDTKEPELTTTTPSSVVPVDVKEFTRNVNLRNYKKPRRDFLIKDILPRGIFYGAMYGPSGSGKTFIAIDMALTVASGLETWHGFPVKQGRVAYLTKEGNTSLDTRFKCWADFHEVNYDVILENVVELAYDTSDPSIIVMNHEADEEKKEAYNDLVKELKNRGPFALVILDTFMEFFDGDSENDAKQVQNFNLAVKSFATELQTNVLVIHHCGKWNIREAKDDPYFLPPDGRGSSAMKGALDYQYGISGKLKVTKNHQEGARFLITKMKDGRLEGEDSILYFKGMKWELRDLGRDEYGDYESSLVVTVGKEIRHLDPTVSDEKDFIEYKVNNDEIAIFANYDNESGNIIKWIRSEDLKRVIHQAINKEPNARVSNQLNPNQNGCFINRLVKAGLVKAEPEGRKGSGKYLYFLLDSPIYEENEGIWNFTNLMEKVESSMTVDSAPEVTTEEPHEEEVREDSCPS